VLTDAAWFRKKIPKEEVKADSAAGEAEVVVNATEQFEALVDWVHSNGGRVDPRVAMGSMPTTTMASVGNTRDGICRGIVAAEDIQAGTELFFCPWSLVIGTVGNTHNAAPNEKCETLNLYSDQVRAGKESFYYPYLSMDDSLATRIPTLWQNAALTELQGLLPEATTTSLTDWYSETCAGGVPFDEVDAAGRQSLLAAISRSAGMRFLPIFDLMNHNHEKMNIRSEATVEGNTVYAAADIPQGFDIYNSYRSGNGASSEVFRRYGFIESEPQQWMWTDATTHRQEWFLRLPTNAIVIRPPESMASQIGLANPPLFVMMESAENHHHNTLSQEELATFVESAQSLLSSLPTTIGQDRVILRQLSAAKEETAADDSTDGSLSPSDFVVLDTIGAVRFRLAFKEAVQEALDKGIEALALKESSVHVEL